MTHFQAWLFTKLNFIEISCAVISMFIFTYVVLLIVDNAARSAQLYKYIRFYMICFFCLFFGLAAFIIPTQKEMAFIYPELAGNEK